jgi:hypothetical protein
MKEFLLTLLTVIALLGAIVGIVGFVISIPQYNVEMCAREALIYNVKEYRYEPTSFMKPDICKYRYKNVWLTTTDLTQAIYLDKMSELP